MFVIFCPDRWSWAVRPGRTWTSSGQITVFSSQRQVNMSSGQLYIYIYSYIYIDTFTFSFSTQVSALTLIWVFKQNHHHNPSQYPYSIKQLFINQISFSFFSLKCLFAGCGTWNGMKTIFYLWMKHWGLRKEKWSTVCPTVQQKVTTIFDSTFYCTPPFLTFKWVNHLWQLTCNWMAPCQVIICFQGVINEGKKV